MSMRGLFGSGCLVVPLLLASAGLYGWFGGGLGYSGCLRAGSSEPRWLGSRIGGNCMLDCAGADRGGSVCGGGSCALGNIGAG
jgi:hypothetical protein